MELSSLKRLAEERELCSRENHKSNDFYHHATILKRYAGISDEYPSKCVIEHAAFHKDYYWRNDAECKYSSLICHGKQRIERAGNLGKIVVPIGPYIQYAPNLMSEEEIETKRKSLGNNLLVFPVHSTHWTTVNYDFDSWLKNVERIEKEFDTVTICLYWKDIQRGEDRQYRNKGYRIVSAGHIYDPEFVSRLKDIIDISKATITHEFNSTPTGYSIALEKPVYINTVRMEALHKNAFIKQNDYGNEQLTNEDEEKYFKEIPKKITENQRRLIRDKWGLGIKKSKEDMYEIFEISEEIFQKRSGYESSKIYERIMREKENAPASILRAALAIEYGDTKSAEKEIGKLFDQDEKDVQAKNLECCLNKIKRSKEANINGTKKKDEKEKTLEKRKEIRTEKEKEIKTIRQKLAKMWKLCDENILEKTFTGNAGMLHIQMILNGCGMIEPNAEEREEYTLHLNKMREEPFKEKSGDYLIATLYMPHNLITEYIMPAWFKERLFQKERQ